MGETEISWTHRPGTVGRTWNVAQGCSRISEGCRHCYAERTAARFAERGWSKGLIDLRTRRWNGEVRMAWHKLHEPLAWRDPSTVFTNSMSDLFHEGFDDFDILAVFGVMLLAKRHTFQVLTKRAARMRRWFAWWFATCRATGNTPSQLALNAAGSRLHTSGQTVWSTEAFEATRMPHAWPPPNVWLGVSVEHQDAADERIPELLMTPAAIRFLSCEPLLGPVDLHAIQIPDASPGLRFSALQRQHDDRYGHTDHVIDWTIVGCESGPGARPAEVAWLRGLRDQCAHAGTAFFLKQAKCATDQPEDGSCGDGLGVVTIGLGSRTKAGDVVELPYLDGKQHAAFPQIAEAA